jgi:hypothetical protein
MPDFNAPVPAFHTFFGCVLTDFEPRQFLDRIVTADETRVRHCEPESEVQSMDWKSST